MGRGLLSEVSWEPPAPWSELSGQPREVLEVGALIGKW